MFEETVDLTDLLDLSRLDDATLVALVADADRLQVLRYLAGPPISEDDLKVLAEAESLARSRLHDDRAAVERIVQVVREAIDQRRFPWISANREPDERERQAATLASACLMAYQRVQADRRTEGKAAQENQVDKTLQASGFQRATAPREINTLAEAPPPGAFCRETTFGTRKADFVVGLYDTRKMPIECKVSNSGLNSIKRLNNDAAVKAGVWLDEFGSRGVVPAAVLSGVFEMRSLTHAQDRGLTLFWAHDLRKLIDWIAGTRG